jgi:PIN domain nuclease of toxin-antitoxin system
MEVLLDTHTALWWASDPSILTKSARQAIERAGNTVWFSVASAWEMSIKVHAGKLTVNIDELAERLIINGIGLLGIGLDDAIGAGGLPWAHRDPFDRMLVAQAQRLSLTLVTRDDAIIAFDGVTTIEA